MYFDLLSDQGSYNLLQFDKQPILTRLPRAREMIKPRKNIFEFISSVTRDIVCGRQIRKKLKLVNFRGRNISRANDLCFKKY